MDPPLPERYNVLGVGISRLTLNGAADIVCAWASAGGGGYVCCAPVHPIALGISDLGFREILNRSLLTTPDGMPVVWLGRRRFGESVNRVYGPDLMQAVCAAGREKGLRHFFYGGGEEVAEKLAARLSSDYRGLGVTGMETPPFRDLTDEEVEHLAVRILESGAQVLWVGLGVPKQERFMARMQPHLPGVVQVGVGAAFDFLSGTKPQAPLWMQRAGLEWLFRMASEPRRLAGRYLVGNARFLFHLALQTLKIRKYPMTGIED